MCIRDSFESVDGGKALHASVTMPSLEVGTVGGGTILAAQGACLDMLGVRGSHATEPGANAKRLASVIAAAVLAGELSLNAALASNHLISAHMALNRRVAAAATAGAAADQAAGGAGHGHADAHAPPKSTDVGPLKQRTSHRVAYPEMPHAGQPAGGQVSRR